MLRRNSSAIIFSALCAAQLDSRGGCAMEEMSGAVKQDACPMGRGIGGLLAWPVGSGATSK
ncbi:hypothetical protein A0J57_19610 [Sphingobium sp. 22B]|uniref:Uncharacterized protein n=1 Tax=Sphingobium chungbukense TaxID=56193 RepID=A0A0M3AH10_9SPHN|nr:hypothetical protein YP76_25955 [Sphingobium chungbukense]KXU30853.1 hypothetical protein AXW74_15840 [Sphingobium sp. AM]KYC30679.1 hypothetical protein A0J57_19610 [Sphingobium sp. 22B]OAP30399.1 hypothetical protein A8O16_18915 [Sphingobium sp. 20006FA]